MRPRAGYHAAEVCVRIAADELRQGVRGDMRDRETPRMTAVDDGQNPGFGGPWRSPISLSRSLSRDVDATPVQRPNPVEDATHDGPGQEGGR